MTDTESTKEEREISTEELEKTEEVVKLLIPTLQKHFEFQLIRLGSYSCKDCGEFSGITLELIIKDFKHDLFFGKIQEALKNIYPNVSFPKYSIENKGELSKIELRVHVADCVLINKNSELLN